MGHQNQINRRQFFRAESAFCVRFRVDGQRPELKPDPGRKHRIGQDGKSSNIEQERGVSELGRGDVCVGPGQRQRTMGGGNFALRLAGDDFAE